jgi:uncharacterized integral membrane protein
MAINPQGRARRMRKFLTYLIIVPLGLIFVAFGVANRHLVTVSFDPFNSADPSLSVAMPLFTVIIAVAIAGVIVGGCASWFGQRHWRRAARRHEADARAARDELTGLREAARRAEAQRLPAPFHGGFYGASGRDKQGATL